MNSTRGMLSSPYPGGKVGGWEGQRFQRSCANHSLRGKRGKERGGGGKGGKKKKKREIILLSHTQYFHFITVSSQHHGNLGKILMLLLCKLGLFVLRDTSS